MKYCTKALAYVLFSPFRSGFYTRQAFFKQSRQAHLQQMCMRVVLAAYTVQSMRAEIGRHPRVLNMNSHTTHPIKKSHVYKPWLLFKQYFTVIGFIKVSTTRYCMHHLYSTCSNTWKPSALPKAEEVIRTSGQQQQQQQGNKTRCGLGKLEVATTSSK